MVRILRFKDVGGVWRSPYVRPKGLGGCRWLMHDEKVGAFILSFGSPG